MLIRKTQTSFQFPTPTPKNNRQKSTAEPNGLDCAKKPAEVVCETESAGFF